MYQAFRCSILTNPSRCHPKSWIFSQAKACQTCLRKKSCDNGSSAAKILSLLRPHLQGTKVEPRHERISVMHLRLQPLMAILNRMLAKRQSDTLALAVTLQQARRPITRLHNSMIWARQTRSTDATRKTLWKVTGLHRLTDTATAPVATSNRNKSVPQEHHEQNNEWAIWRCGICFGGIYQRLKQAFLQS